MDIVREYESMIPGLMKLTTLRIGGVIELASSKEFSSHDTNGDVLQKELFACSHLPSY
jgi:hypothetical protein